MTKKHLAILLAGSVISLALIWLISLRVERQELAAILFSPDIKFWPLIASATAYGCYFVFKSLRWHYLLQPLAEIPTSQLLPTVVLGYAGNVLVPLQLGDAGRAYLLAKRQKISTAAVISTIAVEKIIDVFALLILLLIALSKQEVSQLLPDGLSDILMISVGGLLLAIWLVSLFPHQTVRLLNSAIQYLPFQQLLRSVIHLIEQCLTGFSSLKSPKLLIYIVITTLLGWTFMLLSLELLLEVIDIEVGIAALIAVVFLAAAGLMLPTGPGFIGTIQAAFLLGMIPFQIEENAAIAASILYNTLITIPPLVAGFACLLYLRIGSEQIGRIYRKLSKQ